VQVETGSAICNSIVAYFNYDVNTGRLTHHCSGKMVCPTGGVAQNHPLVVSDNCYKQDINEWFHTFQRDYSK